MERYQQDQKGVLISIAHNPIMANTKLVPSNLETSNSYTTSIQQQVPSITRNNKDASISNKTSTGSLSFIKQYIQNKDLPKTAKYILLSSWHNSTEDRYASTYRKWEEFCISRNINSFQPAVEDVALEDQLQFSLQIYLNMDSVMFQYVQLEVHLTILSFFQVIQTYQNTLLLSNSSKEFLM